MRLGASLGMRLGASLGRELGETEGSAVDGDALGKPLGVDEGLAEGTEEGFALLDGAIVVACPFLEDLDEGPLALSEDCLPVLLFLFAGDFVSLLRCTTRFPATKPKELT